jgi:hypothetical protein
VRIAVDDPNDAEAGRLPYAVDDRLDRPDLLVIGATGRNVGKTELACRLIRRLAGATPVVGLKVTTVERDDGRCPHGDGGCRACASLGEPWAVSRETDPEAPKDTSRLLASGARRVYWLRVLRSEMAGGAAELLSRLPPGWVAVCESNGLVGVVEPGLFLLVRAAGSTRAKPSAVAVAHLADRVVVSDGRSFDLDLDRVSVVDGQWALRRDAWAVVVDGADGRREADRTVALRRTRASLEPQFDRVVVVPGPAVRSVSGEPATAPPGLPDAWCLVTPAVAAGVPPGLVNAMFRRRAEADVVLATTRSEDREVDLALCRLELLDEVTAAVAGGSGAGAALGARCAVTALRQRLASPRLRRPRAGTRGS